MRMDDRRSLNCTFFFFYTPEVGARCQWKRPTVHESALPQVSVLCSRTHVPYPKLAAPSKLLESYPGSDKQVTGFMMFSSNMS